MARTKNVDTFSRVPIMPPVGSTNNRHGFSPTPIPDAAISLTERILSQASNEDGTLYDWNLLESLGIDAPNFPLVPLSLPLSLKQDPVTQKADLSFMNDTPRLARMMLVLLKTIPVVAVDYDTERNRDYSLLGQYVYSPKHIELFSRLIQDHATSSVYSTIAKDSSFDSYTAMCCIVLIHELAHAVMDVSNYNLIDRNSALYRSPKYQLSDFDGEKESSLLRYMPHEEGYMKRYDWISFFNVREESYANVITIKVIANADKIQRINGFQWYLSTFVNNQPSQYALAALLVNDKNIKGWLEAKTDTRVGDTIALDWMKKAEELYVGLKAEISEFEEAKRKYKEAKRRFNNTKEVDDQTQYDSLRFNFRCAKDFIGKHKRIDDFHQWESDNSFPWSFL